VGVDATSIRIGTIYPQSGAFAAFTTQYAKVWRAAFNDVNDREGGIYGRKLILETVDEGESTSQALAAAREIAPKVFGYTTFLQETVEANFAESNGIPALTLLGNITPGAVNGKYRYSFQVGTPPGYYVARNAPSFIHAKFPSLVDRTVLVTGEIYPSAKEAFAKAAARHGVKLVHTETLAINQAQCLNSVQNVADATPKIVFVIAGPIEAGCFFRDAKAVGFQPQFATLLNIPQNAASGGGDDQVPGIVPYYPLESDEGRRMIATYKKYHPNEEVTFPANDRAWASAQMWIQWLRAMGPGPIRKSFPGVVESNGPYANGFDGPQTFSREIHVGSEHTIAGFQAGGGRYVINDQVWRTTYDGIKDPPFFPFRK
jgi:ABC-type branched-subunit amino acid transport system substrate-binding protein